MVSYLYFIIILFFCMMDTVWTVSLPALPDDLNLALRSFRKMDLIRLADIVPIFGVRPVTKGGLGGFNSTFGIKWGDEPLFACNTLSVSQSSYRKK